MKIFSKQDLKSNRNKTAESVPIVKIGNMRQTLMMEGRVIPCIVLDTTIRKDIESIILSHEDINSGYALTTWVLNKKNKNEIILIVDFTEPFDCCFSIVMDLNKYAMAIENIMRYNVVYIQSRNLGESDNIMMLPSVLVEVPSQEAKKFWDKHLVIQTEKNIRKMGYPKKVAKRMAFEHIKEQINQYFYLENM